MSKKKKTIVPKAASAEALVLAEELLTIAETDLRAALVLREALLNPQAVFHLQQAVEKIGKAFGLAMGIAVPEDLQREWSHNTLKQSEILADYREQLGRASSSGMSAGQIKTFIDELKDPQKLHIDAMSRFLAWALSLVTQYEAHKQDIGMRESKLNEMRAWAIGERTEPEAVAKAAALADYMVDMLGEIALILPTTMILGMATAPHGVIARYPAANTTPGSLYREDYPAVRALPDLCTVGTVLLGSVRTMCGLARRLQTIIAMPGGDLTNQAD